MADDVNEAVAFRISDDEIFTVVRDEFEKVVTALKESGELPITVDPWRALIAEPRDPLHGDFASNIAMILASEVKKKPRELAETIARRLRGSSLMEKVDVAGPGFINVTLKPSAWIAALRRAVELGPLEYGRNSFGRGKPPVNVEFVSANPTGPMHVGHGRGAVFGDALARLLEFTEFKVTREYYINDAGAQVDNLARSVYLRYREALGEEIGAIPEGLYPGDYLKPVGELLAARYKTELVEAPESIWLPIVRQVAIERMLVQILTDLRALNISFDAFFSERALSEQVFEFSSEDERPSFYCAQTSFELMEGGPDGIRFFLMGQKVREAFDQGAVETSGIFTARIPEGELGQPNFLAETLSELRKKDLIYEGRLPPPKGASIEDWEDREQTLFRSTKFGDVIDRPLKKSDGSYTYFASDIAYHRTKVERGFRALIDVWGADHAGYIKRMEAAVAALSDGKANLDVKVIQLVKLMRAGDPIKMSKRSGDFVTLREVIDEVGRDAVRFMMLYRKNDAVLEFDLAKVIEQSRDNPVFYVQYGYARAQSVFRNARAAFPDIPQDPVSLLASAELERLSDPAELALMRRIAHYRRRVLAAAAAHEPHRIAFYLFDLASEFHALWTLGNSASYLRFIIQNDRQLTVARLVLVSGVITVLASGLKLLGVGAPSEMR
jgi:arginyl-tRNA synthetase